MTHDRTHRFRQGFLDMVNSAQVYRAERDSARSSIRRQQKEIGVLTSQRDSLRRRVAYLQSDAGIRALARECEQRGWLANEPVLKEALAAVIEEHRRRERELEMRKARRLPT